MLKSLSTFILLIVLLVSGCTIEKRLYRKGWYISYSKSGHTKKSGEKADFNTPNTEPCTYEAKQLFSVDSAEFVIPQSRDTLKVFSNQSKKCMDNIEMKPISKISFSGRIETVSAKQSDAPPKEKNRERDEPGKLVLSVISWLIFFSVLMVGILILFPPLNISLYGLLFFVGVFMILFIGILSLDAKKRNAAQLKWVELTGDMLSAYRGYLLTDAIVVTLLLLSITAIFLIVFSGSLGFFFLLFISLATVLIFFVCVNWSDFQKVRKTDSFKIMKRTSRKLKLGDETDFRKPSEDEISEYRRNRFKRALAFEIFLLFVVIVTIWAASIINPVSIMLLGVLGVLVVFFSFLIWFDVILKRRHPEWERVVIRKKKVPQVKQEEDIELEEEDQDPNDPHRLIRTTSFLGFAMLILLILALLSTGEFLWVMFGVVALAFIVTLTKLFRTKKTETP